MAILAAGYHKASTRVLVLKSGAKLDWYSALILLPQTLVNNGGTSLERSLVSLNRTSSRFYLRSSSTKEYGPPSDIS